MDALARSNWVKQKAKSLGFSFVGVSKAGFMEPEAKRLEAWLNGGMHGKMSYMENHFDKRVDPTKLVPGAKSVISLMYNYATDKSQIDEKAPKISKYAYGQDYHHVVKDHLRKLLEEMRSEFGDIDGRCFVDSAPVMERDWAKRSGLGWIGKHTLLLNKKAGSYFFLAELILDIELAVDSPVQDHCGTCTRCIDACPTDAIAENGYWVDASKCISYLTIELKESIPQDFKGKMEGWAFGCDICQEVCPWNKFSVPHSEPAFEPQGALLEMKAEEWEEISESVFKVVFKNSAVKRTKYSGLRRNIDFIKSS